MVGPIAKQCLEGLGRPPSLWSLETLVNAGIILGFFFFFYRSSAPLPSTPKYTVTHCACTDTHGRSNMGPAARHRSLYRCVPMQQQQQQQQRLMGWSHWDCFWVLVDGDAQLPPIVTAQRWGHPSTPRSRCDSSAVWGGSGFCPGLRSINGLQVHPLITAAGALAFSLQLINNTLPFLPREP